jgi:hypothetical protein
VCINFAKCVSLHALHDGRVYCPAPDGVSQINTLGTVWLSSSGPLRSPRLPEKSERLSVGAIFHLENGWRFFIVAFLRAH